MSFFKKLTKELENFGIGDKKKEEEAPAPPPAPPAGEGKFSLVAIGIQPYDYEIAND